MPAARDRAKTELRNELVAGRLVGLGRRSDSYNIETIDCSFWIGAKVDWEHDAVSREDAALIDVRVVAPETIKAIRPTPEPRSGPPSEVELILAAIEDYAKKDPALRRPPAERYGAYRSFIVSKGRDPRRERGFSESAFEKYEREYRLRFK
jgi:hypothetical protein